MRAVICTLAPKRDGGLLPAVQAAIGAAPAAAGGTVIAVSVRSAPTARSAALGGFCNSSPTLQRCHNHCGDFSSSLEAMRTAPARPAELTLCQELRRKEGRAHA
jgi:hypothetical protein